MSMENTAAIMAEIRALRDEVALLRRAFAEDRMQRPQQVTQAREMMEQARRDRDAAFWANVRPGDMQGL